MRAMLLLWVLVALTGCNEQDRPFQPPDSVCIEGVRYWIGGYGRLAPAMNRDSTVQLCPVKASGQ